jgi:hypothetical protein
LPKPEPKVALQTARTSQPEHQLSRISLLARRPCPPAFGVPSVPGVAAKVLG